MKESEVHDLIVSDEATRNDILKILQKPLETKFIHEDEYNNGIIADFTLLNQSEVVGIMECKGGGIGVNEYVRGIGQVFQYEYFFEEKQSKKGYQFSQRFNSILLITSSLMVKKDFNIALFKYPQTLKLLEINEFNKIVREISKDDLKRLREAPQQGKITISPYYFRDNRIHEYYLGLKYLAFLQLKGRSKVDRPMAGNFLKQLNTINKNNWRNAFITLSSLGIIDSNNLPTEKGVILARMTYPQFATEMFFSYLKPYVRSIFEVLPSQCQTIDIKNYDIQEGIKKNYNGKEVLFLTEASSRYISSFMNILRDDYGAIQFKKQSSLRQIIYNPCNYNKEALIKEIEKQNGTVKRHLENYHNLLNNHGKQ